MNAGPGALAPGGVQGRSPCDLTTTETAGKPRPDRRLRDSLDCGLVACLRNQPDVVKESVMNFSKVTDYKTLAAFAALALLTACGGNSANTGAANGTGAIAAPTGAAAPGSEADLVANVGDRVYFDFNQNGLSDDAKATLTRQAAWLQRYPQVQVQIAGNCDDRGTEEYNIALGERRANAARDFLVAQGVSSDRITTISYGKDRPTATGDDEQAWSQNRNAITSVR